MSDTKDSFNEVPVHYCRNCLSLKIKTVIVDSDLDFCDDCGSTDIEVAHIDNWEKMYEQRYGFNYLNNISNGRK